MNQIIELLHFGNFSCVIKNKEEVRTFTQRGIADLYDLYQTDPLFLRNAAIADKVVGKGAAAMMALSQIKTVYADVISKSALNLLRDAGIEVTFAEEVPYIINRDKTGKCPLETACEGLKSVTDIYSVIRNFVARIRSNISHS